MSTPVIHELPVVNTEPVMGVCPGREVAYWPTMEEIKNGFASVDGTGYITGKIVSTWSGGEHANPSPSANIQLFPDRLNIRDEAIRFCCGNLHATKGSVPFSLLPARGCWTWIPKA